VTTNCKQLAETKEAAYELYLEYRIRKKWISCYLQALCQMACYSIASKINNHNSALNRGGCMNCSHMPVLINKGKDNICRPDFCANEYRKLIRILPRWIDKGRESKSRDMRHLLGNYVLILANTGIRYGTEADYLCWKRITLFKENRDVFLEMNVRGTMGRQDIWKRQLSQAYPKFLTWCCGHELWKPSQSHTLFASV
jgi:hypothetical protein